MLRLFKGIVAEQIGLEFANSSEACDRVAHKWMHGVSAAVFAGLGAAALGDDVEAAALGAAAGAMTAEVVADALASPLEEEVMTQVIQKEQELGRELTEDQVKAIRYEKIEGISQVARLVGSVSGVLTGEASGVSASNRGAEVAVVNNTEKTLKEKSWSWEGFKAKKAEFMNACKVAAAGCALALGAEAVVGGSALATAGATLPIAAGVSELTVQACTGAAVICGAAGADEGIGQNVFTKEKAEGDAPAGESGKKILGESGTQVTSKTVWKGQGKERIDVENPNPGQRPGQIHHQDNEGNKYLYDPKTDSFVGAPKKVNDLLQKPEFRNAIKKGMRYLGEEQ